MYPFKDSSSLISIVALIALDAFQPAASFVGKCVFSPDEEELNNFSTVVSDAFSYTACMSDRSLSAVMMVTLDVTRRKLTKRRCIAVDFSDLWNKRNLDTNYMVNGQTSNITPIVVMRVAGGVSKIFKISPLKNLFRSRSEMEQTSRRFLMTFDPEKRFFVFLPEKRFRQNVWLNLVKKHSFSKLIDFCQISVQYMCCRNMFCMWTKINQTSIINLRSGGVLI